MYYNYETTHKNKGYKNLFLYLWLMVGIYKITSPSNKIYIGQSIDIEKRFNQYKWYKAKSQPILNRSFLKYGVDKHKFEVVCECKKTELHDLETYYQTLYCVVNSNGLNCFINNESSVIKVILRKEKYKKEEILNNFYINNKGKFIETSNLIDSIIF